MKVSELSRAALVQSLRRGEFLLRLGPFVARITSDTLTLADDIALMYGDFGLCPTETFADFHVEVARETGVRRWIRPLVRFFFDGRPSFIPLPAHQAFAMLEWGLNWCVAAHSHQYLVIHAAVIEKDGKSAVMPAPPGSGKSTLCTGMVMRGWRLLSDELALYDMETGLIHGMSRPINLKNRSIEVIRGFAPDAIMTAAIPDTTKGTVCLLRPPKDSVRRFNEPVHASWIILPKYVAGAAATMTPHSRARTFMLMAQQSFNYDLHGEQGFKALGDLVTQSQCYQFSYSELSDAERILNEMCAGRTP